MELVSAILFFLDALELLWRILTAAKAADLFYFVDNYECSSFPLSNLGIGLLK